MSTHAVVSWIWNADGTAGIQRLAIGTQDACAEYALIAKPVTDDPREVIVVVPNVGFDIDQAERLRGLN